MKFIVGYAGIPSSIYDEVRGRELHILSGDTQCRFVSRPLRPAKSGELRYSKSDANFFLREFAVPLVNDNHNELCDTGVALIYVNYDASTTLAFANSFFPSVFTIPVDIDLSLFHLSKHKAAEVKNKFVEVLRRATTDARNSITVIKKEITEHDSRTPLLLPIRNFESKCLVPQLKDLQVALSSGQDKVSIVKNVIKHIENRHPLTQTDRSPRRCFVDCRDIEFHPPGSARHAFARNYDQHPYSCFLSGRRRLGAPYDRAFHYDCIRGNLIGGNFWGCHEEPSYRVGSPHLNIAPNDYVR
jgi:hypothetical protein